MKTVVLIPAHNEAKSIGLLVSQVRALGFTVVVVDDGSVDATSSLARESGATVIATGQKSGKGEALKKGLSYCMTENFDAVVLMDGDGQHAPWDIQAFLDCHAKTQADVVAGNRMENHQGMPWLRLMTNRFMSGIISLVCRQSVPDTQCGFRFLTMDVLRAITLTCSDFEIETEVLIKASRKGFKIASVPVTTIYRDEVSKINPFKDTLRFFAYLTRELCRRDK